MLMPVFLLFMTYLFLILCCHLMFNVLLITTSFQKPESGLCHFSVNVHVLATYLRALLNQKTQK